MSFSSKLVIFSFVLVVFGCANNEQKKAQPVSIKPELQNLPVLPIETESRLPHYCEQLLLSSTWETTTLYDLIYQCPPPGWKDFFNRPEVTEEIKTISDRLALEVKEGGLVNPDIGSVFKALYLVGISEISAVIIGQDPAPRKGLATGLAFSLKPDVPIGKVPSVQRVILEAKNEGFCMDINNGDLSSWATNGVLLLNTALTIPCQKNNDYCSKNGHKVVWGNFTNMLIGHIEENADSYFAYILWGDQAKAYATVIRNKNHKIITGGHPSPLATPTEFFCKNYFNCSNKWLIDNGKPSINWGTQNRCEIQPPCVWDEDPLKCKALCAMSICN
jgi:uracil-DNA glycosylase